LELIKTKNRRDSRNLIATLFSTPTVRDSYHKQMEFFRLGKTFEERALLGGNRVGKTLCGVYEDTLHLTGQYPDWWPGIRWSHPVDAWAATDTAKNTRDILQEKFCGKPGDEHAFGTGMIPGDLILRTTVKHGLADCYESIFVRHVPTGGVSTLQFKSYDQGRVAFQGTAQHHVHLDEEPDLEIYAECLMRIMTTNGRLVLTETPLFGVSDLMVQFMPELNPDPDRAKPLDAWEESNVPSQSE
jgi:phage terminase large subunit-like protein